MIELIKHHITVSVVQQLHLETTERSKDSVFKSYLQYFLLYDVQLSWGFF